MFQSRRAAGRLCWLCFWTLPRIASAQIDYRNLDDDRPVGTEDAYPAEHYAAEIMVPYRFEAEHGGVDSHAAVPELAYGVVRNTQIGVKLPVAAVDGGAATDWGLAGVRVFALYNFNSETPALPAISVRADASFPLGSLAGDETQVALEAIVTRSWGTMRVHLNASRTFGSNEDVSTVDPLPHWRASLAIDRTFFRPSLLVVAEIATTQLTDDAASGVTASLGGRWQWTPTLVLDLGVSRRLSDLGPDIALTIGLSHTFAIRALLPAGLR